MIAKKKPRPAPIDPRPEEGIYGITDDSAFNIGRAIKKPEVVISKVKKKKPEVPAKVVKLLKAKKKILPKQNVSGLAINYEPPPKDIDLSLPIENLLTIPDALLKQIKRKTDKVGNDVTDLVLQQAVPLLLGYDSAHNHVETVLSQGFKLEGVEFSPDVLNVVQRLTEMSVIFYYLKKIHLPISAKRLMLRKMSSMLAEKCIEALFAEHSKKANATDQLRKTLEGIVVRSRSTGQNITDKRPAEEKIDNSQRSMGLRKSRRM